MNNEEKLEALKQSYVKEEKVYQDYLKNSQTFKRLYDKAMALTNKQKRFLKILSGKITDLEKRIKELQPW